MTEPRPMPQSPSEALSLVYDAQVQLSEPYVTIFQVQAWANMALNGYAQTGIASDKVDLLEKLVETGMEFEGLYRLANERLKDMLRILEAIEARRESL